jgi:ketosteroid isomerase-like protein
MSQHPNARLVRELFDAFERRDLTVVLAALAEDVVWHFPGRRGALAGDHVGRDAVLAFLAQVPTLTEGTFHARIEDVAASEDGAVVLFRGSAVRGTKRLDNPTCLRIRIEDGRIRELWEFVWDLEHVEDFWS